MRQVLPVMRFPLSSETVVTGSHVTDEAGNWLLVFDNSYSVLRSKTVFFRILCSKPSLEQTEAN